MESNSLHEGVPVLATTIDLPKPMEKTELTSNTSETFASAFEKENHRIGFIQKLLCIKVLQALLVTAVMAGFVAGGFPVYKVMVVDTATRIHFIIVSTLVFVVVVTLIHSCTRARTKSPNSYIFLVVYPVSGGFFITVVLYGWALNSMLLSWVQFNCVLFAFLLYSIWSFETNLEFDTTLGLCISAAIFIISYACTIPFIYDVNGFAVVCFSLIMFLTTTYVLYDIEEMVSEDYHASLTPADYFKAAVYMHVDHCYLVMKLYNKHRRASLNVYDGDKASG